MKCLSFRSLRHAITLGDSWINTGSLWKHKLIRLLQNSENHSPRYTRNRGTEEATGEWLTFVDSDDNVDTHLLEKAEAVIATNDRDAVPTNRIVYDFNIVRGDNVSSASSMYGNHRGGVQPVSVCIAEVCNHVVGKVYKTDLTLVK